MAGSFRVGISRDFLNAEGETVFPDIGLSILDACPRIEYEFLPENRPEISAAEAGSYDAFLLLMPRVTKATLAGSPRVSLFARFGVGYDSVDIDACTAAGTAVTITPDAVQRPVAIGALTYILALTQHLVPRDRLTKDGRWAEKNNYIGVGLTDRTIGFLGWGRIGQETTKLLQPLDVRQVAHDPFVDQEVAAAAGVAMLGIDELFEQSDVLVVLAPLTEETHHIVNLERLNKMKKSAFLVNVARGPLVDQDALYEVLKNRTIAGAGLDVFDPEPPEAGHPLFALDNLVTTPHSIAWSDQGFQWIGESACKNIVRVAEGEEPQFVVNRAVLGSDAFGARASAPQGS